MATIGANLMKNVHQFYIIFFFKLCIHFILLLHINVVVSSWLFCQASNAIRKKWIETFDIKCVPLFMAHPFYFQILIAICWLRTIRRWWMTVMYRRLYFSPLWLAIFMLVFLLSTKKATNHVNVSHYSDGYPSISTMVFIFIYFCFIVGARCFLSTLSLCPCTFLRRSVKYHFHC